MQGREESRYLGFYNELQRRSLATIVSYIEIREKAKAERE